MTKKKIPELKIELANDGGNLLFLALLEYKRDEYLCVIDNITPSEIGAYVLDFAEQEKVPIADFFSVVINWFYANSDNHPLSVSLAQKGLTERLAPIYKTFDATYVSRIIGNAFTYDEMQQTKVKRRRVVPIPEGIPIRIKKSSFTSPHTP